jgi:hypothetical protein
MDEAGRAPRTGRGSGRRARWPWLVAAGVVVVAIAAVAVGWFGVHKLFIDDRVDEAVPVFDSGAGLGPDEGSDPPDADPGTGDGDGDASPTVATVATGTFSGVGRYSGEGTVVVLTDGSPQRFLRFEDDFSTSNGPDLFVYLGTGSDDYRDPEEYVELGVLRGNIGSQNYEIPATHPETAAPIDLDRFDHVVVWCKRFDATFAVAQLT